MYNINALYFQSNMTTQNMVPQNQAESQNFIELEASKIKNSVKRPQVKKNQDDRSPISNQFIDHLRSKNYSEIVQKFNEYKSTIKNVTTRSIDDFAKKKLDKKQKRVFFRELRKFALYGRLEIWNKSIQKIYVETSLRIYKLDCFFLCIWKKKGSFYF